MESRLYNELIEDTVYKKYGVSKHPIYIYIYMIHTILYFTTTFPLPWATIHSDIGHHTSGFTSALGISIRQDVKTHWLQPPQSPTNCGILIQSKQCFLFDCCSILTASCD